MPTSICPECREEVFVDAEVEQGDSVICDECSSKLVVVGLDPIELDLYDEESNAGAGEDDLEFGYDDEPY